MANKGPDTNGSQFFFTLDKADELNGKNTMFGRIAGDTIYNLTKIGEAEVADMHVGSVWGEEGGGARVVVRGGLDSRLILGLKLG